MAANFNIQMSAVPLPHKRECHVAVSWKNTTIILGGNVDEGNIDTMSTIYLHRGGKWMQQETFGDFPQYDLQAYVVNDEMFVINFSRQGVAAMHSLDLLAWTWTRLSPNGTPPLEYGRSGARSWAHQDKIYSCGSYGRFGQVTFRLFCYNTSTNSWEWPVMEGEVPSPRRHPLVTKSGNTAFLFGGWRAPQRGIIQHFTDLHMLDLSTMRWKKVHDNLDDNVPNIREGIIYCRPYSFTSISQSLAVVIGCAFAVNTLGWVDDCWLLNLDNAKQLMEPPFLWTKITNKFPRFFHAAVLQPLSKNLWLIGGRSLYNNPCATVLKIKFTELKSLKDLALESVASNICDSDPRLGVDQLPRPLTYEIEAYTCETGEPYLCPRHVSGSQMVSSSTTYNLITVLLFYFIILLYYTCVC